MQWSHFNPAEIFNEPHGIPLITNRHHQLLQRAKRSTLTSVLSEVYRAHLLSTVVLRKVLFPVISVCGGARITTADGKAALSWDLGRRETEMLEFAQAVALQQQLSLPLISLFPSTSMIHSRKLTRGGSE